MTAKALTKGKIDKLDFMSEKISVLQSTHYKESEKQPTE